MEGTNSNNNNNAFYLLVSSNLYFLLPLHSQHIYLTRHEVGLTALLCLMSVSMAGLGLLSIDLLLKIYKLDIIHFN